jgi:hypothetical protein
LVQAEGVALIVAACPKPTGHAKVRPPVPSWQILKMKMSAAVAPEVVELVTFPVSVICHSWICVERVNVGVAEKLTVVRVTGLPPKPGQVE